MIDKEYIKEIISCITKKKADGNIVPATASMSEIMTAVREDALECMRTMCDEREIAVNRTLKIVFHSNVCSLWEKNVILSFL